MDHIPVPVCVCVCVHVFVCSFDRTVGYGKPRRHSVSVCSIEPPLLASNRSSH